MFGLSSEDFKRYNYSEKQLKAAVNATLHQASMKPLVLFGKKTDYVES